MPKICGRECPQQKISFYRTQDNIGAGQKFPAFTFSTGRPALKKQKLILGGWGYPAYAILKATLLKLLKLPFTGHL